VLDNGIGLSADQRQIIFDLFVQVDNSLARSQGGLGVGLTLSQRLVELHGGRIEAHSAGSGQGSEFVVSLPLLEEPAPEKTMRTTSASGPPRPRILVIDDNADAALTLSMLLKLKGYDVQSRHSGREGIQAAEAWRPGVIVCDISMPEMDGYQTARLIREQPWGSAVYLVALTGYSQAEDKERALEAGFDAHLVKPVDLEALLGLLM
jgi:CheY-like chemotaxis protein